MRSVEMTAEQRYQELYFAEQCLESDNPMYRARGERILQLYEAGELVSEGRMTQDAKPDQQREHVHTEVTVYRA